MNLTNFCATYDYDQPDNIARLRGFCRDYKVYVQRVHKQ